MNKDLFEKGQKYIIAFSGGSDSVFGLIQIMKFFRYEFKYTEEQIRNNLLLVYINYHDSDTVDKEQKIVEHYVDKYNLDKIFVMDYDCINANNFEDAARAFRYEMFKEISMIKNCKGVIVCEHLNDYIETYILQKQRNNIVDYYGLKDVAYLYDTPILRPFLKIKKDEIIQYCNEKNFLFYDDPTNNHPRKRNILRKEINKFTDEDFSKLFKEIDLANKQNDIFKEIAKSSFLSNNIFHFNNIPNDLDEKVKEDIKKRIIYKAIKNINSFNEKYVLSNLNIIYYLIKGNKNGKYKIDELNILLIHKNKYMLVSSNIFNIHLKIDKYTKNIYKRENCEFDTSREMRKYFNFEAESPTLTNCVTLKAQHQYLKVKSKLKGSTLEDFFKKQGFPLCLIDIYPIIVDKNKNCVYVPRYQDLFSKYINTPYMLFFKDLID